MRYANLFFINSCSGKKQSAALKNNKGAAMVYLISVIMLMSVLGTAILKLSSTATLSHIAANHMDRAYFMAEAGGNYAIALVKDDIESDGKYDDTYSLHNKTFTLDTSGKKEDGKFKIEVDNSNEAFTRITSIGSIDAGVSVSVTVRLIYDLAKTAGQPVFDRSLFSGGKMVLGDKVYVNGDVGTNAAKIDKKKGVKITGTEETSAGKTLDSVIFLCGNCTKKKSVKKDETWNSGTYEYQSLTVGKNNTITIKGDVVLYVKEDFIMEEQTGFKILDNASLTVYVGGNAEFYENFTTEFPDGPDRPEDFIIFGTSQTVGVRVYNNSTFIGGIYAPDSNVEIQDESDIRGSLVGKEVKVNKNSNVIWDEDMGSVSSPGKGSVTLSNPVQYFSQ